MQAEQSIAAESKDRVLVITRDFDAPRELVFKAWTDQEHMANWFGPKGFQVISCTMELHVGGSLLVHSRSPEDTHHYLKSEYREIVRPEKLVCTYAWCDANWKPTRPETLLTLTFEEVEQRTRMTLHQAVFESVTACDMHRSGWGQSLDRFAAYLAKIA